MNTTHIGIPDDLKTATDRDEFSTTCHFESKEKNFCLNTYIVKKISTFDIVFELANALGMPFLEQRNLNGLQKPLLKKINYVLNKEEHVRRASKKKRKFPRSGNRQRCRICLNGCKAKSEKDRLNKKQKKQQQQQQCESCSKNTCDAHSICVCDDCNKA